MNKFEAFVEKHFQKIAFFLLVVIVFNTCGNPVKPLNKRVDSLTVKIDSMRVELNKKPSTIDYQRVSLESYVTKLDSKNRTSEELKESISIHKQIDSLSQK
jgi:hypothetical protein